VYHVLFLCTGNSARSIMAEALLNDRGKSRFRAFSAGSHPKGAVHPMTLDVLNRHGVPTSTLRSKRWDEFGGPQAPPLDVVVTVCDRAAAETCPVWPGQPTGAHWSVADPAAVEGSPAEQLAAFEEAFRDLDARITRLAGLPLDRLDRAALKRELEAVQD
jgi:protein-tyrosine-phosphatase